MLELSVIRKSYEAAPLLDGVSFSVADGERIALLGPSGSGKTTLLRIIAGIESPESGQVSWDSRDLAAVPVHRREFGMVFQDYALFPHLDVSANVAFGLKMRAWSRPAIDRRVGETLELVNLRGFEHRGVNDLSGGEQQRVALARALAPKPRLLMFDEPLAALDRGLREDLLMELRRVLREAGVPAIYVTHDQQEAFAAGERILILHHGRIVRAGTPEEVTGRPGSAWTARFLGLGAVVEGTVRTMGDLRMWIETSVGTVEAERVGGVKTGQAVHVLLRPERIHISVGASSHRSQVSEVLFTKDRFKVALDSGLYFFAPAAPKLGETLAIRIDGAECLTDD